ncbi:MAG: hypothetical protein DRN21_00300 [Thermoplasmata archaeon]|nr:MAG: hypothetical protein DRN21_00300 [Thermoplasmata archaeon]
MNIYEWKKQIEEIRKQKDAFFLLHQESPISPKERTIFERLRYYPPDESYYFELKFHEYDKKEHLQIEDTKGVIRHFIRWGEFRFQIHGKECVLHAYKSESDEERLFVPFRDETSGKETYGAGRYLDLTYEKDRTPEGKWILDFNKAYNPWCAYSEKYACPFVPPENWLAVPIKAGEKNYSLKGEKDG